MTKIADKQINDFAKKQWEKSLAFLQGHFNLHRTTCEDIFQESFIVLYENIKSGKLDNLTSSLSSYFLGICKHKALEAIRATDKNVTIDDELSLSLMDGGFDEEKINSILALDADDTELNLKKGLIVREIVKNLPSPCNELLWGYYRDNLKMVTRAKMYNYKSEGAVKVTKHRCLEKFRNRFSQIVKSIF